ncbi:MAG: class I SAM-dependent methyltransferase [Planctomycetota bacterium]|nr:class I SAM-dependent methyltransferase [Planctomycetota bacterium]
MTATGTPSQHSTDRPCPLCDQPTRFAGAVDFNKSGADVFAGARQFAPSDELVSYLRCGSCGFMFTSFFDGWTDADFSARIYNAEYLRADPPFEEERPARLAGYLAAVLAEHLGAMSMLDFGSGAGRMMELLRARGLRDGHTYDRYHAEGPAPTGPFDLVTAFEVVEHVVDQVALLESLCGLVAEGGVLVLSTLLQPANIADLGAAWWYACPRNGHLAFHSSESLTGLLEQFGFELRSVSSELHVAFRRPGALARSFLDSAQHLEVSGPEAGG